MPKYTEQDVLGRATPIRGGIQAADAVVVSLVAQRPQGTADLSTYAPMPAGRIAEGVLDTEVRSSAAYLPFYGVPGSDTEDANCVIEFPGNGVFVNAALCQQLGDAETIQRLIDERLAMGIAQAPDPQPVPPVDPVFPVGKVPPAFGQ
jgi:hypothetical protein